MMAKAMILITKCIQKSNQINRIGKYYMKTSNKFVFYFFKYMKRSIIPSSRGSALPTPLALAL